MFICPTIQLFGSDTHAGIWQILTLASSTSYRLCCTIHTVVIPCCCKFDSTEAMAVYLRACCGNVEPIVGSSSILAATSCGSGAARGPRICQFGGCRNACWQAGELTRVSIAMFAAVKEQATSEKARRSTAVKEQARKRRRTNA